MNIFVFCVFAQMCKKTLAFPLTETTLKPQRGSVPDSARYATSPTKLGNSEKILKDKVVPLRPRPTTPAVPVQCTTKGLVSPAEAPVILSSTRTTKTDSYDLVWRPRHDGKTSVLYYHVKHRKVSSSPLKKNPHFVMHILYGAVVFLVF